MFDLKELERAHEVVGRAVPPTPSHAWPLLARRLGTSVVVKHENHTPTAAFKVRGGLVYFDRLKRERPGTAGLISATRGNHGQSLAFAASRYRLPVTIYVPHGNSVEQNRAARKYRVSAQDRRCFERLMSCCRPTFAILPAADYRHLRFAHRDPGFDSSRPSR